MTQETITEKVFRCLVSKIAPNEYNILEIAGFIDPKKIEIKKSYFFTDRKKTILLKKEPKLEGKKYLIRTSRKRYHLKKKLLTVGGKQTISKRTRTEIHHAIKRINQRLISTLYLSEKDNELSYYLIIQPEPNKYVIDKKKFYKWIELTIERNASAPHKKIFLKWLVENLLNKKSTEMAELDEGGFIGKTPKSHLATYFITPTYFLNEIYKEPNGKLNLKIDPKTVYLRLLEFIIKLMSERRDFKHNTKQELISS